MKCTHDRLLSINSLDALLSSKQVAFESEKTRPVFELDDKEDNTIHKLEGRTNTTAHWIHIKRIRFQNSHIVYD